MITHVFTKNNQVHVIAPLKQITKPVLNKVKQLGATVIFVQSSRDEKAECLIVEDIKPISSSVQSTQRSDYEQIVNELIH